MVIIKILLMTYFSFLPIKRLRIKLSDCCASLLMGCKTECGCVYEPVGGQVVVKLNLHHMMSHLELALLVNSSNEFSILLY